MLVKPKGHSAETTLMQVEERSQSVLANADQLLNTSSPSSSSSSVITSKARTPRHINLGHSATRKPFTVLENLVFESVCRNFTKSLDSSGGLFGKALSRLIHVDVGIPTENKSTHVTVNHGKRGNQHLVPTSPLSLGP